nr:immunoglobulin heavy chain junction region [Macaca mulatta]MOW93134.1 immunoglobulin heavy chain junction region [Macaca mulatta]
CARGVIFDLW